MASKFNAPVQSPASTSNTEPAPAPKKLDMASKFNPPALQSQTSASNTEPAPAPKKLDLASKFGPASKGSDGADTDGSSSDKPAAAVTGRVPGKLGGGLAGGLAIPMHLPGMGPPPGLAKKLAPSPGTDSHLLSRAAPACRNGCGTQVL